MILVRKPHLKSFMAILLIWVLFGISVNESRCQEPVFIGSPDIFESTLTKNDIKDIFMGKKKKWAGGKAITLTVNDQADLQKNFTKAYLRKTPAQFINFWKYQIFVGNGNLPKFFTDENQLIDYIEKSEGAIGYISTEPSKEKNLRRFTVSD
ncbi:MAG: hypothetical protein KJ737_26405 [Proteobacteria bacterium]|nr:hypothetical protein [Pseudomonadota bacterium]